MAKYIAKTDNTRIAYTDRRNFKYDYPFRWDDHKNAGAIDEKVSPRGNWATTRRRAVTIAKEEVAIFILKVQPLHGVIGLEGISR